MPKIDTNKVTEILKRNNLEPAVLRAVVEEMWQVANVVTSDAEAVPATKKQFVILVSDPEGLLPKHDFAGWVLQVPESESVLSTEERIVRAAHEFNSTKKGRLLPAKTVGEALEFVPPRNFKECDLWVKTKTPVLVLRTDGIIPRR